MAHAARLNLRMQKELKLLLTDPPPGASFPLLSGGPEFSSLSTIEAQIEGPEGTAYATGIFSIKIQIPERYPFQPPSVTFLTPIYHPNIDNRGRICLDILNLPPKGAWQPSLNISTVLTSIGLLLSEPNPDDGLMCEASREYKYNRQVFDQKARAMTEKYAKPGTSNCSSQSIQMDTSSSTMMEVKELDKESAHKFQDFVSTHKRPCGIGGKLSLRSSSSTHNECSDGDAKDMPNRHLLLDSQIHIERNEERKELRIILDEYNLKYENPDGRGKKLSLESSVQYPEKDGHNTKGMNPKQSHSFFNQQTAATTSLGLPEQLIGNCNKQRLHHHDDKIQTFDSNSKSSKKLCEASHKMQPRSFHAFEPNDSINEVMLVPLELLPSQSYFDSSETLSLSLSCKLNEPICKDSAIGKDIGSINTRSNGACLVRKKLSMGLKVSSLGQEKDEKDNNVPIHNLPFSNPQVSNKTRIGQKLSFGPLNPLQGSNEDTSKSILQSQNLVPNTPQRQQFNQYRSSKTDRGTESCGEDSPVNESVIVMDSEGSEEETNGSVRSTLSLVQKRILKRKTHA